MFPSICNVDLTLGQPIKEIFKSFLIKNQLNDFCFIILTTVFIRDFDYSYFWSTLFSKKCALFFLAALIILIKVLIRDQSCSWMTNLKFRSWIDSKNEKQNSPVVVSRMKRRCPKIDWTQSVELNFNPFFHLQRYLWFV